MNFLLIIAVCGILSEQTTALKDVPGFCSFPELPTESLLRVCKEDRDCKPSETCIEESGSRICVELPSCPVEILKSWQPNCTLLDSCNSKDACGIESVCCYFLTCAKNTCIGRGLFCSHHFCANCNTDEVCLPNSDGCLSCQPNPDKRTTTTTSTTTSTTTLTTVTAKPTPTSCDPPPKTDAMDDYACVNGHKEGAICAINCKRSSCIVGELITKCECDENSCSWSGNPEGACEVPVDECQTVSDCQFPKSCYEMCGMKCIRAINCPGARRGCDDEMQCRIGQVCRPGRDGCLSCQPSEAVTDSCGLPPTADTIEDYVCPNGHTKGALCFTNCKRQSCMPGGFWILCECNETSCNWSGDPARACPVPQDECESDSDCQAPKTCVERCSKKCILALNCPGVEGSCGEGQVCHPSESCRSNRDGCLTCLPLIGSVVSCDPLSVTDGMDEYACTKGYNMGSECYASCKEGFYLEGNLWTRCDCDGDSCWWGPDPNAVCKEVPSCPLITGQSLFRPVCTTVESCSGDNVCDDDSVCCYSSFCKGNMCWKKVKEMTCFNFKDPSCFSSADCPDLQVCHIDWAGCLVCVDAFCEPLGLTEGLNYRCTDELRSGSECFASCADEFAFEGNYWSRCECEGNSCRWGPEANATCIAATTLSPEPPTWTNWSTWSMCSVTCGIGRQERTRGCLNGEVGDCGEGFVENRACNTHQCRPSPSI